MKQTFLDTIQQYRMLQGGESIALGVSGGKDSVALLTLFSEIQEPYRLKLFPVHVHHGIRGAEADADEQFVTALCEKMGLSCKCFHFDVPAQAEQRSMSVEECARVLRYEAFESMQTDIIATAHTLSDSVETILFHLARGSGAKGLCGIPAKRGKIIRPLIHCTRRDVEEFVAQRGLDFVEDSTNALDIYARNAIRHRIVPEFEALNKAFEENVSKTARIIQEQNRYIAAAAKEHILQHGADAKALSLLPDALRHEAVRQLCEAHGGVVPEYRHMVAIDALLQGGSCVQINGGARLRVRKGMLEFPREESTWQYDFELKPGEYELPVGTLKVQVLNCEQFENLKPDVFSFALDYDKINAKLLCRNKEDGDAFFDGRRGLKKTMKKYLNEIAFLPERRNGFPVFILGEDIIGTLGSHTSKALAPGESTKRVLYLFLEEK